MRSMMAKNHSITVQVLESSIAATAKEELSLPIDYDEEIVVPRARAPLGLGMLAQATQSPMKRLADEHRRGPTSPDTAHSLAQQLSQVAKAPPHRLIHR